MHAQQERQHHIQQVQQTITDQTHNLDQQQGQLQAEVQQQQQQHRDHLHSQLTSPQTSTNLVSDNSNTRGSQDNNQSSSIESNQDKVSSEEGSTRNQLQKRKKKGGKAKGTLETSVEIRNRMIGMSEAGLSTLSIALAIDRSVRRNMFVLMDSHNYNDLEGSPVYAMLVIK